MPTIKGSGGVICKEGDKICICPTPSYKYRTCRFFKYEECPPCGSSNDPQMLITVTGNSGANAQDASWLGQVWRPDQDGETRIVCPTFYNNLTTCSINLPVVRVAHEVWEHDAGYDELRLFAQDYASIRQIGTSTATVSCQLQADLLPRRGWAKLNGTFGISQIGSWSTPSTSIVCGTTTTTVICSARIFTTALGTLLANNISIVSGNLFLASKDWGVGPTGAVGNGGVTYSWSPGANW